MMDKLTKFAEENDLPLPLEEEWESPDSPDPVWEAAVRGDYDALISEMNWLHSRLKAFSLELKSLTEGLATHAPRDPRPSTTQDSGQGSDGVSPSPRDTISNTPTPV